MPTAPASRQAAPRSGGLQFAVYDVRELTAPRSAFLPPRIDGLPTGSDDDRPRSGGEGDPRPFVEPDMLIHTLELAIAPDYWSDTEGASMEVSAAGLLLVRAHPAIHDRIGTP